jgi:acetyl esterase
MKLIAGQRILGKLSNVGPGLSRLPLGTFRFIYNSFDQLFGSGSRPDVSTENLSVSVGERELDIRIYRPTKTEPKLTMVYFHGGGYVIGGFKSHHGFCSLLAGQANINLITVDYRLAPESQFPGPLQDGLDAWNWVTDHAAELGISQTKIGMGGDSAGGNLAAVLSMQTFGDLLDGDVKVAPVFQFLLYPWVDMSGESDSIQRFGQGLILTQETMTFFRDAYLPKALEPQAIKTSPILCEDMSLTPDTMIVTAEYDVLRDEGLAFVDKLQQAQVSVSHLHLPDCTHGFISTGKFSSATRKRLNEVAAMLDKYAANI